MRNAKRHNQTSHTHTRKFLSKQISFDRNLTVTDSEKGQKRVRPFIFASFNLVPFSLYRKIGPGRAMRHNINRPLMRIRASFCRNKFLLTETWVGILKISLLQQGRLVNRFRVSARPGASRSCLRTPRGARIRS